MRGTLAVLSEWMAWLLVLAIVFLALAGAVGAFIAVVTLYLRWWGVF